MCKSLVTFYSLGQRAGYSKKAIDGYVTTLRKSGIAQRQSNQALLRAVQGNIDMTDAVKLGRIAQDAAVIGQTNSSDAYNTLIDAVVKIGRASCRERV